MIYSENSQETPLIYSAFDSINSIKKSLGAMSNLPRQLRGRFERRYLKSIVAVSSRCIRPVKLIKVRKKPKVVTAHASTHHFNPAPLD
jgi:hypothetical protein